MRVIKMFPTPSLHLLYTFSTPRRHLPDKLKKYKKYKNIIIILMRVHARKRLLGKVRGKEGSARGSRRKDAE